MTNPPGKRLSGPDFEHLADWMAQMDAKHPEMYEQDFLIAFPEAKQAVAYVQGLEQELERLRTENASLKDAVDYANKAGMRWSTENASLRERLALAEAWLEAEDGFQREIYDTQGRLPVWPEVIEARERFRASLTAEPRETEGKTE